MNFFRRLFGSKGDSTSKALDEAIKLDEDFEYSSNDTKSSIHSGLLTIQKMEEAEEALRNSDIKRAVTLFEEAAALAPKEKDKEGFLAQAENLRRFI